MSTSSNVIDSSAALRISRRPTEVFKGHINWVRSIAYFPGERRIASAPRDSTVIIWDVEGGGRDGQPLHPDSVVRKIASGMDGRLVIWDALTREVVHEIKGDGVWRLAYSPDGRRIANGRLVTASSTKASGVGFQKRGMEVGKPMLSALGHQARLGPDTYEMEPTTFNGG
ncbi:hypothetical protein BV22DRAFT_1048303 [Leucogyrophana mollusca]|uniref:Uncharacterized protein n=1 Tax=Leucogyrophana mollusca TaxID=85980 RepID=A0ACB8BCZ0_9AGAM|nr:hypothetical protein BV22DRAFT_1048303 [Leucogyrophana mollusca]